MQDEHYIPLSALQHYAYCPRQCALIHLEQTWSENFWTAEGRLLHERVDAGESEQRGNIRTERSVNVISHRLKIMGKLDLLEIQGNSNKNYYPVEYKRGKPKIQDWDKVQLCAQVLCLEEMLSVEIKEAALWYWQVRHREKVAIDIKLRSNTKKIILNVHSMFNSGMTPKAVYGKYCQACSLVDLCGPKQLQNDNSKHYLEEIFLS